MKPPPPNKMLIGDTVLEHATCERCGQEAFYIRLVNTDTNEAEMIIKCLTCDTEYRRTAYQPNMCTMKITDIGMNKIAVIRAVREVTYWGLKESKDWVEAVQETVPRIFTANDFTKGQLIQLASLLNDAGSQVNMELGNNCNTCLHRFKCFTER